MSSLRDGRRTARELQLPGADLRGADLTKLRADGLDLTGANLRGTTLSRVRWVGCRLLDADLSNADLDRAVLRTCELSGARASGARLTHARIENDNAQGADFGGADFTDASLVDTNLSRARLRKAQLRRANASGVILRGADLRGACLADADLSDADLRGADLTDADLRGADLRGADLRGAIMADACLDGAELSGTRRDDAPPQMPQELQPLSTAVSPLIVEVLTQLRQHGHVPKNAGDRLLQSIQDSPLVRQTVAASPEQTDSSGFHRTVSAVMRALGGAQEDVLEQAAESLRGDSREPSPGVADLIRRVAVEMGMDADTNPEDLLSKLTGQPRSDAE
ncbi:MAG: pentapeptide repeat-containing protein [Myxococcota bacterium]